MLMQDEDPSPDPISEDSFFAQLGEVQREITASEMGSSSIMQVIVDRTRSLLGADGGSMEMIDGDFAIFRCGSGMLSEFVGFKIPLLNSISGLCVTSGQPQICNDSATDHRVNRAACEKLGIRSMLLVPLSYKGAVVGVLKVSSRRPNAFNQRSMRYLQLMTSLVGMALMHARDTEINQRLLAERQVAVTALQESEDRFRKACEDASIGMALVAVDGRWIKVNSAMCEIVGLSETQLLATDFQSITHPDDLNADLSLLHQLMAGEIRTYQLQKRYIHSDGHQVWVQLNVSLVRDASNSPLYLIAQVQDVTESKRMEDSCRESERAYRAMFDLAGAGIANIDLRDGRFIAVNQKLCELLGYSKEELAHLSIFDLSLPEDRLTSRERIRGMAETSGRAYAFDKQYIRKDGTLIWVAIDATSFVDGDGNPTHVVAMYRDITEQRDAEESMRASERHFRTLADHAPVAIFQADLDGNLIFSNARWCQLTGMSFTEAQGHGWMATIHPDDLPIVTENRRTAIVAGREYSGRYRHLRRDGEIVWVQGSATPLMDDAGKISGYLGTATDLTDRMRAEWLEGDRREVLEMVAKDQPIDSVLRKIVLLLERQVNNSIGAVLRLGTEQLSVEAPGMSSELITQLRGAPISLAGEFFARVGNEADGVGVSTLEVDTFWIGMRSVISASGLRVAWIVPIASSSASTLGWLTLFSQANRRPTRGEIELMLMVSKLSTISIEHHQTTQKLAHLVRHDVLTGLPNRLMLSDRLDHAIALARRSGRSVGLMVLDIDKFKSVNDTLGHHAGDELLRQFSKRLSNVLRKTDTMSRYGGDEFVVVLPEIHDTAAAVIVAQKLVDAMVEPFTLDRGTICQASTSIGIALFPDDAADFSELQQFADAALYHAKAQGRNGFSVYQKQAA